MILNSVINIWKQFTCNVCLAMKNNYLYWSLSKYYWEHRGENAAIVHLFENNAHKIDPFLSMHPFMMMVPSSSHSSCFPLEDLRNFAS